MTLDSFNLLIRKAVMEILSLTDKKAVRISWPKSGMPDWSISENVIFVRSYPVDDPYNRIKDIKYREKDPVSVIRSETYTRVMGVDLIMYGPDSFDHADLVRNDIGKNETLKKNKVFLVYDRKAPVRSPELFRGQWWERSTLSLQFNEQIMREYTNPTISDVRISVRTEGEEIYNGNITT